MKQPAPADGRPVVLVVDDSVFLRQWTRDALEEAGYGVLTADTVWVDPILRQFAPDLVLMDVEMGTENGADATLELKRKSPGATTRIVLYSSKPPAELAELAQASGADGFLHKVQDPDELTSWVRGFLSTVSVAAATDPAAPPQ